MKELNSRLHGVVKGKTMSIADVLTQAGMRQGMRRGKLERSTEIARNLLVAGIDAQVVSQATGLPRHKLSALGGK